MSSRAAVATAIWLAAAALVRYAPAHAADSDATSPPNNAAAVQELPQVTVIGNAPLPGLGLPLNQVPVQRPDRRQRGPEACPDHRCRRLPESQVQRRQRQRERRQPVPARHQLPRLHRLAAAGHARGPLGVRRRRARQRVLRRHGQLGPDPANQRSPPCRSSPVPTPCSASTPSAARCRCRPRAGTTIRAPQFEAYGGSFGRRAFEAETGGERGAFDYFATVNYFDETGWRDMSPTRSWQAFGKVGWQTEKTDLDLSYTYADTSLFGNGALPQSMLDVPPRAELHARLHAQPAALREPDRHAVPVRAPAAVRQRLLPPPDHRQQQRQQQRQLPERGLPGTADRLRRHAAPTAPRWPTAPRPRRRSRGCVSAPPASACS